MPEVIAGMVYCAMGRLIPAAQIVRRTLVLAADATVQDIIYFLYPELSTIPGVAALHPVMQQACAQSTVPCYFLDLNPLWSGHPEYTDSTNLLPSEAGAQVIGDNIWNIMQRYCIAQ